MQLSKEITKFKFVGTNVRQQQQRTGRNIIIIIMKKIKVEKKITIQIRINGKEYAPMHFTVN